MLPCADDFPGRRLQGYSLSEDSCPRRLYGSKISDTEHRKIQVQMLGHMPSGAAPHESCSLCGRPHIPLHDWYGRTDCRRGTHILIGSIADHFSEDRARRLCAGSAQMARLMQRAAGSSCRQSRPEGSGMRSGYRCGCCGPFLHMEQGRNDHRQRYSKQARDDFGEVSHPCCEVRSC